MSAPAIGLMLVLWGLLVAWGYYIGQVRAERRLRVEWDKISEAWKEIRAAREVEMRAARERALPGPTWKTEARP